MSNLKFEFMWNFLRENDSALKTITDNDILCVICTKVLINAYSGSCGCRYCLKCVQEFLNDGMEFCPGSLEDCKEQLMEIDRNVLPDRAINQRISRLVVKCPHNLCEFTDSLRQIEDHIRVCNRQSGTCPFLGIGCLGIRQLNENVNEHLMTHNESHANLLAECIGQLRNEIGSTKNDVANLKLEIGEIKTIMEQQTRQAGCSSGDGDCLRIRDLSRDNGNEIERREGRVMQVPAREDSDTIIQMSLEMAELRTSNERLRDEFEIYRMKFLQFIVDTEKTLSEIKSSDSGQNPGSEVLEHSNQEQAFKPNNDGRVNDCLDKGKTLNENVFANQLLSDMEKPAWGEFWWRINDWSTKRRAAEAGAENRIFSESFLSHENGYRMCLCAYPYGVSDGLGTHLSIYFYLMPGSFDAELEWPLRRKITLAIVNQSTGLIYERHIIDQDTFPDHANWSRPISEIENGFGFPKFINLNELSNHGSLCRDDQIFIKCSVQQPK